MLVASGYIYYLTQSPLLLFSPNSWLISKLCSEEKRKISLYLLLLTLWKGRDGTVQDRLSTYNLKLYLHRFVLNHMEITYLEN